MKLGGAQFRGSSASITSSLATQAVTSQNNIKKEQNIPKINPNLNQSAMCVLSSKTPSLNRISIGTHIAYSMYVRSWHFSVSCS